MGDTEFAAMLDGARARGWRGIVLALALGRFAGWPTGDITNQPPSVWQRPRLSTRAARRGERRSRTSLTPDPLIAILDEIGVDTNAKTLVVNESGEPIRRTACAR